MSIKVHVVTKNGNINERDFTAQMDAINYARQSSLNNLAAVLQSDSSLSFYQYGDLVTSKSEINDIKELITEVSAQEGIRAVQDGKKSKGK